MHVASACTVPLRGDVSASPWVRRLFATRGAGVLAPLRHARCAAAPPPPALLVSRSPRKLLRTAAQALDDLAATWARHPESRTEAVRALGADGVARLEAAVATVRAAAEGLDLPGPPASGDGGAGT